MALRSIKKALGLGICLIALCACGEDGEEPSDQSDASVQSKDAGKKDAASSQPTAEPEPDYSSVPALPQVSYTMLKETACKDVGGSCIPHGDCAREGGALLGVFCPNHGKDPTQCCHVEDPCEGSKTAACCIEAYSNGMDIVGTDRTTFCQGGHLSCLGKHNVVGSSPGGDCRMGVVPVDENQPSLWPGAIGLTEATRKACEALGGTLGNIDTPGKRSVASCNNPDEEVLTVASLIPCCIKKGSCKPANPATDCCGSNGGGGFYRAAKDCVDGQAVCASSNKEAPKGTCNSL